MIFAETNSLRKGLSLSVDCELFFRILHLLIRPPRTVFAILAISFAMFAVFPSSAAGTILRTWDGPVTYDANTDMFEFSAPLFDVLFDSGQVIEANGEAVLTVEIDAEGHVTFGTLSIFGSMPGLIPNPSSLLAGLVNSQILFGGGPLGEPLAFSFNVVGGVLATSFKDAVLGLIFEPEFVGGTSFFGPGSIFSNSFDSQTTSFGVLQGSPRDRINEPTVLVLLPLGLLICIWVNRRYPRKIIPLPIECLLHFSKRV